MLSEEASSGSRQGDRTSPAGDLSTTGHSPQSEEHAARRRRGGKGARRRRSNEMEDSAEGNSREKTFSEDTASDIKMEQPAGSQEKTRPPHRFRRRGRGQRQKSNGVLAEGEWPQEPTTTEGSASSSSSGMKDSSDGRQSPRQKNNRRAARSPKGAPPQADCPVVHSEGAETDPSTEESRNDSGDVVVDEGANPRQNCEGRRESRSGGRRRRRKATPHAVKVRSFCRGFSLNRPVPVSLMSLDVSGNWRQKTLPAGTEIIATSRASQRSRRPPSDCIAKGEADRKEHRPEGAPLTQFILEYLVENGEGSGRKHPLANGSKTNREMVGSQLLLPILLDRVLGEKVKRVNEEAFHQIVDHFAHFGLNYCD